MSTDPREDPPAAAPIERAAAPEQALRRLFLTLFLRGRSARGLDRKRAPGSIAGKLWLTLLTYALFGLLALTFMRQSVFALSAYLHAMTFAFLGLFVASSAGEILFNREEADILLHRPVTPKALLWAKVRVLVSVSLWLALAFNLVGLGVGALMPAGNWLFVPAHLLSITLEALFGAGTIVLVYQLCLRFLGRERLDGLMTTAQVLISVGAMLAGQLLPRLMMRIDGQVLSENDLGWWLVLLPPAWFAGIDDVLSGNFAPRSWLLSGLALTATGVVMWAAFERMARDYEIGLQAMNETSGTRRGKAARRWLDALVDRAPLRWCLKDPVARASFLLTAAYFARDRDVKLRLYPGLAPFLALPFIFLVSNSRNGGMGGFDIAFAGVFIGQVPMLAITMLQYSQQWQASDVFRAAPLAGPGAICSGARLAVLWLLTLPFLLLVALLFLVARGNLAELALLLPGALVMPLYALVPNLGGKGVPLSVPGDEAKSARRGLVLTAMMFISLPLAGGAALSWWAGYLWLMILVELIVVLLLYFPLRASAARARWVSME